MDLSEVPEGHFLRHPWEVARARFFLGELRRSGVLEGGPRVLDVGSGDGWFAGQVSEVRPDVEITCWDVGYSTGTPPKRERLRYTATRPEERFDVVLLLDVAEHVSDDHSFMADVLSLLKPAGAVLFSVPAWPRLYSKHDEVLGHYRRYSSGAARRLLADSSLTIQRSGGLFHTLLLPRFVSTLLEKRPTSAAIEPNRQHTPPALAWAGGRFSQQAALLALALDGVVSKAAASAGVNLPGLSWWALCRK